MLIHVNLKKRNFLDLHISLKLKQENHKPVNNNL